MKTALLLLLCWMSAFAQPPPPDGAALREAARAAQSAGDCAEARRLWAALIALEGDDLEAWKGTAQCQPGGEIEAFVEGTTEVFEDSFILQQVPAVLDRLKLKELVPILSKVETQEQKSLGDYVLLSELYRRMNDPARALGALNQAVSLDPQNGDLQLEYGELLFVSGRVREARAAFREGVSRRGVSPGLSALYAAAMGWPLAFLLATLAPMGLALTLRLRDEEVTLSRRARVQAGLLTAALALAFSMEFLAAGHRGAFLALLGGGALCGLWVFWVPLRRPLTRLGAQGLYALVAVATGRVYGRLTRVPLSARLAVLLACTLAVLFAVPRVGQADLRVGLLFLLGMLFFTTLGSLLLTLLQLSASLRLSLRGLAFAGTLPFLVLFLYLERESLTQAVATGALLNPVALERTAAYLVVWAVAMGCSQLLARILSRSILDPLKSIDDAVVRIRGGDFEARPEVDRRDELGALALAVGQMAEGLAQRERIKDTFRQYVDPAVAERLMAGDVEMNEARRMHAAVMFADVRGFTTLSEQVAPEVVVTVLNEIFTRLAPTVTRWGGVVDKYMGDAMMAVWGVPEPAPEEDHAGGHAGLSLEERAVSAALDMLEALDAVNIDLAARGLPQLALGIGINSGPVIAGPIGSAQRREYTVIGDVVNTAQRAEGVARDIGRLLITEAVAERARGRFELTAVDAIPLKGKRAPVQLYRVEGRLGAPVKLG